MLGKMAYCCSSLLQMCASQLTFKGCWSSISDYFRQCFLCIGERGEEDGLLPLVSITTVYFNTVTEPEELAVF